MFPPEARKVLIPIIMTVGLATVGCSAQKNVLPSAIPAPQTPSSEPAASLTPSVTAPAVKTALVKEPPTPETRSTAALENRPILNLAFTDGLRKLLGNSALGATKESIAAQKVEADISLGSFVNPNGKLVEVKMDSSGNPQDSPVNSNKLERFGPLQGKDKYTFAEIAPTEDRNHRNILVIYAPATKLPSIIAQFENEATGRFMTDFFSKSTAPTDYFILNLLPERFGVRLLHSEVPDLETDPGIAGQTIFSVSGKQLIETNTVLTGEKNLFISQQDETPLRDEVKRTLISMGIISTRESLTDSNVAVGTVGGLLGMFDQSFADTYLGPQNDADVFIDAVVNSILISAGHNVPTPTPSPTPTRLKVQSDQTHGMSQIIKWELNNPTQEVVIYPDPEVKNVNLPLAV